MPAGTLRAEPAGRIRARDCGFAFASTYRAALRCIEKKPDDMLPFTARRGGAHRRLPHRIPALLRDRCTDFREVLDYYYGDRSMSGPVHCG